MARSEFFNPVDTAVMGGVPTPPINELVAMQGGDYVLRARGGEVTKVPAERSVVPHDPEGFAQLMTVLRGPGDTVYVTQPTLSSKSEDGGRTWTTLDSDRKFTHNAGKSQVLSDGTFITVIEEGPGGRKPLSGTNLAAVWASYDEGRTFEQISHIPVPDEFAECDSTGSAFQMTRLPDDTLLWVTCAGNDKWDRSKMDRSTNRWKKADTRVYLSGKNAGFTFCSTDGGHTWEGPNWMADWFSEGGMAGMASGKLLSAMRYSRPLMPGELETLTGGDHRPFTWEHGVANTFKHVLLADSRDNGRTWTGHRLLTTVYGQTYGFPTGLSDGTAVVLHDHRYPRGEPHPLRSMVSHDEGDTWEDEVYYLVCTDRGASYGASVTLDDDTVVTVAGIPDADAGEGSDGAHGHSSMTVVRWKPERD
mgnify:CR=1 FL=1